MLGKLLKYEFKANARTLLPLYLALLVLSLINGFTIKMQYNYITAIAIFLACALSLAIAVSSFILILQRFWNNLLKDEGYLMFTLPVKTSCLVWSKLISGITWAILSFFVGLLAMLIWFTPLNWDVLLQTFNHLPTFYNEVIILLQELNANPFVTLLEIIILIILSSAYQILVIYSAMAIGQTPIFSKHRVLASFGAYIIIHWLIRNLIVIIINIAEQITPLYNLFNNLSLNYNLAFLILIFLVGCAVFFFLTNYLLNHKLNLE